MATAPLASPLPLKARAYGATRRRIESGLDLVMALYTGFWLGVLDREDLYRVDQQYYDAERMYRRPEYNLKGLWNWESRAIATHFADCRNLLVASAGGGREMIALLKLDYEVEGFECNPSLVEFGNRLLEDGGYATRIRYIPPDECPPAEAPYQGAVVGWGAYMHIAGRERRIRFARDLRAQLVQGAPLLLSFYGRSPSNRAFHAQARVANLIRFLRRKERLEVGDTLSPNFCHSFVRDEIADELREAGFELVEFSTEEYCHAVARAC